MRKLTSNVAIFGAFLLLGCQEEELKDASAIPPLEAGSAQNAESIVQFVDQQCVGRASDLTDFQRALDLSNWGFEQTQKSDQEDRLSLDVWKTEAAQIVLGEVVEGRVYTCWLAIGLDYSPDERALRSALIIRFGKPENSGAAWTFSGPNNSQYKIDVGGSTDGKFGTNITVEEYQ